MEERTMKHFPSAKAWLAALAIGAAQAAAVAAPVYQFTSLMLGDTAAPADINDHGVVVFTGFGDFMAYGASWVGGDFVQGYDGPAGVQVTDINNAGDYYGTAMRDGVPVPTLWIGGVPHDLTDPANAGLAFEPDAGPKWTTVDPWALQVTGEPFPAWGGGWEVQALVNAAGQLVVGYYHGFGYVDGFGGADQSYAVLVPVPEPATVALVAAALAGALAGALVARQRRGALVARQRHAAPRASGR
jgi:hypothetical protein